MAAHLALVREGAARAGRDPSALGVQGLVPVNGKTPDEIRDLGERWRDLGATHVTVDPRAVSLHVDKAISMAEKVERRKASLQALIDNISRAGDALSAA